MTAAVVKLRVRLPFTINGYVSDVSRSGASKSACFWCSLRGKLICSSWWRFLRGVGVDVGMECRMANPSCPPRRMGRAAL